MSELLVLCPFGLDEGLVSKAASMGAVRVLVPEAQGEAAARFGAQWIHTMKETEIPDEGAFADWLAERVRAWGSRIILAPATVSMRTIMPMLAWKLEAGLTADCTALSMEGDFLLQTRPAFGNSLMATIRTESPVQMATVRPGTFPPVKAPNPDAAIAAEAFSLVGAQVCLSGFSGFSQGTPLTQAPVIVAGGMGVGSKAGFQKLERLAQRLGGALGASRTAVDAGLAPYRCQVGMTGVTVCPRLYLAVGISGAVQHLAGMSGAETVIAINSDPKAPIFDYADYGIVGDWETIIDQLLEEEFV